LEGVFTPRPRACASWSRQRLPPSPAAMARDELPEGELTVLTFLMLEE
jgi:hypothetical protein